MKILSLPAIGLIRFYQKFISPLTPPRCKYYPTCSAYALEAYRKHGLIKGTVLSTWRLLRCNPWSLGGIDYVPERVRIDYFRIKGKGRK
ncbi:MAG: membrane protein insertion efficiency factor YidD [Ruminococcus sp.]|nr:membrane protein insertion efficiency factor YidD [Ruminococcus sp.]